MSRPIPDKAEVALEYPDKLYIGSFERAARFDAHLDRTGIVFALERTGGAAERKTVRIHLNHTLFAAMLHDLARTVAAMPKDDLAHREDLAGGALALAAALKSA
jgi:hypothetical protein